MKGGSLAQITVFNPLSWSRKEWINVTLALPDNTKNIAIQQGHKPVSFEIIKTEHLIKQKTIRMELMLQVDIPALALQSFAVVKEKQQEQPEMIVGIDKDNLRITTPYWIITLNKNGGISNIMSRSTNKQMLLNRRNAYFAGVINGQPLESSGRWDLDSSSVSSNQIILHENGNIGPIPYRLEMKLNGNSPGIDFNAKFNFNDEKIGRLSDNKREITSAFLHEEKLRFKLFPDLGIGTTGIRDLPFTVAETEDKYIEGNYWTAIADGHKGMAIFNRGTMGSVYEQDKSFSLPLAYSMYYVWKTVMLKGEFKYEFAIYPFEGRWGMQDCTIKHLNITSPA